METKKTICSVCSNEIIYEVGFFSVEPDPQKITCERCQWQAWAIRTGYCSQNEANCETCSLVNYGMDCHNAKIQHNITSSAASALGSLTSDKKKKSSPENGKKGGRPRRVVVCT